MYLDAACDAFAGYALFQKMVGLVDPTDLTALINIE